MDAFPSCAVPGLSNVTALPVPRKGGDGVEISSRDPGETQVGQLGESHGPVLLGAPGDGFSDRRLGNEFADRLQPAFGLIGIDQMTGVVEE